MANHYFLKISPLVLFKRIIRFSIVHSLFNVLLALHKSAILCHPKSCHKIKDVLDWPNFKKMKFLANDYLQNLINVEIDDGFAYSPLTDTVLQLASGDNT